MTGLALQTLLFILVSIMIAWSLAYTFTHSSKWVINCYNRDIAVFSNKKTFDKPRRNSEESSSSGYNTKNIGLGTNIRQARISRSIRDELSQIISEVDIKANVYPDEDLLRGTIVTEVEISPDLTNAKAYISVHGSSVAKTQVFVWLCENTGQVKYSLAKRLRHMKRIPDIFFKLVDSREVADLLTTIDEISSLNASYNEEEDVSFEEIDNNNV